MVKIVCSSYATAGMMITELNPNPVFNFEVIGGCSLSMGVGSPNNYIVGFPVVTDIKDNIAIRLHNKNILQISALQFVRLNVS